MHFLKKTIPKFLLISSCSLICFKKGTFMSQQPLLSQILRGEYQNKIRRFSPPQKIFDVFATFRENGQLYMTLHDLLKAICFYNFSVSDEKQTENYYPQTVIELVGKKDKFQFYDYFILVRFLAFEKKKIQKYFKENVSERMSKQAFKKYLLQTICADYSQFIKPSIFIESRQFKPNLKSFQQSIDQSVESVFKNHPKGFTLKEIIEFRRSIIRQLFGFEFLMFKHQDDKIDGTDFARSIVKYVQTTKRGKYTKRVKQFNDQFSKVKIGMSEYVRFHAYLQNNFDDLVQQLNSHGAINTEQIYNLMNKYSKDATKVTKQQTDLLIRFLDIDDSGFIQKREFLGVLGNLQYYTQVKSGQLTFTQVIQRDWNKVKSKTTRILQIIQE